MWEQDPRSGDDVVFVSGQSLGRIDVVRQGEFRVMTREGPLWLSPDVIFTRNGKRLTLVCEANGLDRFTPEAARHSLDRQARVRGLAR